MFKLIVAEKDKVARSIIRVLAYGKFSYKRIYGVPTYFSKPWVCMGVRGHLMDLDFEDSSLNIWRLSTLKLLFDAPVKYRIKERMGRYVKALRYLAKYSSELYLALDNDIEGEHIAWEVLSIVKSVKPNIRFFRVRFSSLDPAEIRQAFMKPDVLNYNWIEKCSARQEVDLRSGAIFTRLLTLAIRSRIRLPRGFFLSYGPCQSPTLHLIVKPYLEWESGKKFKYILYITLKHPTKGVYNFSVSFKSEDEVFKIYERVRNVKYARVVDVRYFVDKILPPLPLDAYELISRASKYLGFPSKKTMDYAEELYRRGLISYPRTETQIYRGVPIKQVLMRLTEYPKLDVVAAVRKLLSLGFIKPREGRKDDKAHPPIYPVRAPRREDFGRRELELMQLYDFIVRHFIATLMPPCIVRRGKATITMGGLSLEYDSLKVLFPGYTEVYYYEKPSEKDMPFKVGDILFVYRVKLSKVQVKPEFLSESTLVKMMRDKGIGTDSTVHEHIHTNIERRYAIRRKGKLIPTELGITIIKTFLKYAPELVDVDLRSKMENILRLVGEGMLQKREAVREIMKIYRNAFDKLFRNISDISKDISIVTIRTLNI